MPKRVPKYCLHRATQQAYVKLEGKRHYLGVYGSPESHRLYAEKIADWQSRQTNAPHELKVRQLTVFYWKHAKSYYVKNGQPSGHLHIIRNALKYLNAECRDLLAVELGPKRLIRFRDALIKQGHSRKYINDLISVVKRMYRWALEEELVTGMPNIQAVLTRGIGWVKKGRTKAKEPPAVKPVPDAAVDAIRPHVRSEIWAMIDLQRWTGMRPGEVLIMRGCDLNTSGPIWEYRPESHKTEHHGKDRVILIGQQGQAVLKPFLRPEMGAYLFSPSSDGSHPFRRDNYTNAIRRGCEFAFEMPAEWRDIRRHMSRQKNLSEKQSSDLRASLSESASRWRAEHCWSPNQLRHNFATRARREFGIEAARVTLGHSSAVTSEIYAERDLDAARVVVARIG